MLRKAVFILLALAALSAVAVVAVVALAAALFAALAPGLGVAGSAAVVGVVFILVLVLGALLATAKSGRKDEPVDDSGLLHSLIEIARAKPLLAAGAAIAAGVLAVRNPAVVAAIIAAMINRPHPKE